MAHKGYIHPPGIPGVMQKEFVFPGGKRITGAKDPEGYSGSDYRKRKKVTGKGHTWQSRKRAEGLKSRQFMKKFKGEPKKKILV